jgi:hypothetical protein
MTVYPLERNLVFEPEIIQVMAGAYEELLGALQLADRNDPFSEVVAKEVIELARLGVRDAAEMCQQVLVMCNAANGKPWKISSMNWYATNVPEVTTLKSFLMLKSGAVSAK